MDKIRQTAEEPRGATFVVSPRERIVKSYAVTESELQAFDLQYATGNRAYDLAAGLLGLGLSALISIVFLPGSGDSGISGIEAVLVGAVFVASWAFYLLGRSSMKGRKTLLDQVKSEMDSAD